MCPAGQQLGKGETGIQARSLRSRRVDTLRFPPAGSSVPHTQGHTQALERYNEKTAFEAESSPPQVASSENREQICVMWADLIPSVSPTSILQLFSRILPKNACRRELALGAFMN